MFDVTTTVTTTRKEITPVASMVAELIIADNKKSLYEFVGGFITFFLPVYFLPAIAAWSAIDQGICTTFGYFSFL